MNAKVKWVDKMRFLGTGGSGHALVMDASFESGGQASASTPMELCLMALMGCTGMDVVSILKKMDLTWESFEMEIPEALRAEKHPMVFTKIHILFRFKGDLPEEKVAKAIALSHEKYCSVGGMLGKTAQITTEFIIEKPNQNL